VWKVRIGRPEARTPMTLLPRTPRHEALEGMRPVEACPIGVDQLRMMIRPRGVRVEITPAPRQTPEQFYGLGLQLGRLNQTGRKRTLRVNSDPIGDCGDSHAPVPFFVSTAGYGVFVDTARYATFYMASHQRHDGRAEGAEGTSRAIETSTEALYAARQQAGSPILIDVPAAQGVDVYIFGGPTPLEAVQRYNLLAGGGCLPPMWGLGVWYRMDARADQQQALALAASFRAKHLPCDVLGLEPGWQTHAYACSYVWNPRTFADPETLVKQLREAGFQLNLWEHVFVDPSSPLHEPLRDKSGDYQVWGGLVPDLALAEARQVFGDFHRAQFIEKGISGFKLDECDNSDFIAQSPWSFPEASAFPSGLDGEQMHAMLGGLYQRTLAQAFEQGNQRTYGSVRSAGAMAAGDPFVLYSDLYDHRTFVRGVAVSGFCGLLWTPEVRHATSADDLIRRIQTAVLSPQALINAWYIKNPPWLQFDRKKNNADELLADAAALEGMVRELLRLRMALVPYLYAAFARYWLEGVPPFRALVLDWPDDPATHHLDDQYMMGNDLLAAPIFEGQHERAVYLPAGTWYNRLTRQRYEGKQRHLFAVAAQTLLLFVREGTMLPLAEPVESVVQTEMFDITMHLFGAETALRPARLFEDDGMTFNHRRGDFNHVIIRPDRTVQRIGTFAGRRYRIVGWEPAEA
jgi:alpha-D-xyloside xylohydrolase